MEVLTITPTQDTPEVCLDPENGIIEFKGRCLPENVVDFFEPVEAWVVEYLANPTQITKIIFNLEYFNTASSKIINEILQNIEDKITDPNKVELLWYYEFDDEDMLDIGREFKDNLNFPFELIPVEVTI